MYSVPSNILISVIMNTLSNLLYVIHMYHLLVPNLYLSYDEMDEVIL